ncbi:squalene--hopene cyclase [Candidatus Laterigemmans baculatus]|uniref:squalene--hopene cyclase n=1 Tax=Candidatus Laterigemmans baculatus TaxID=2770505 RepID=UPI001F25CF00|nr:squalene--hopene cyclase [Candidatus Laterigemmans baculatus]
MGRNSKSHWRTLALRLLIIFGILGVTIPPACGQLPGEQFGEVVPRDIREMYALGLRYLATTQQESGDWQNQSYGGPGVTGMAVMAFLASGEDPNFGLHSHHVRGGLRSIIRSQDAETGIIGDSMYHHGFAMLALAEAYGAVDDRNLWSGENAATGNGSLRSIGESLELAVRGALTSQKKNPHGAWRYSPDASDADTSVSGAVLVGLLGARNAGIEVPDEAIDRAIAYYRNMTSPSGQVAYTGGIAGGVDESPARISIASLVYAIAKRRDLDEYQTTLAQLTERLEQPAGTWIQYARYYQAQALFQGDPTAWEKWNQQLARELKEAQQEDGHFTGEFGPAVDTSLSLLALALNYRFLPIYER